MGNELLEIVNRRLEVNKNMLARDQEIFRHFVDSELTTSCFERNCMSDLVSMLQLKATIAELEQMKLLLESQLTGEAR